MNTKDAMKIITNYEGHINDLSGYMVSFENRSGGFYAGHFPDKHAGEPLIKTEIEAWDLAERFANATGDDYVNIYVINQTFHPVKNYKNRILKKYPSH